MGLGLASAAAAPAAPAATIPLDPAEVELFVHSDQNSGAVSVTSTVPSGAFTPVATGYGGSVTFTIPAELTFPGALPEVALSLAPTADDMPTKTYETGAALPADRLTVTDLGGGTFEVDIPADNGTDGDIGFLEFTDLTADSAVVGAGVNHSSSAFFVLDLAGGVTTPVNLTSQLLAVSAVPCWTGCPDAATLTAGSTFVVTLPATSKLSAGLGLVDFSTSAFSLVTLDSNGDPTGTPASLMAVVSADGLTATLTVPAGTAAGRYSVDVGLSDAAGDLVSYTSVYLTVAAPAVAAAPTAAPVQNVGLRSNTGWGEGVESVSSSGASPLVTIGGGMLLVAGAGAGGVLRTRRRAAADQ